MRCVLSRFSVSRPISVLRVQEPAEPAVFLRGEVSAAQK